MRAGPYSLALILLVAAASADARHYYSFRGLVIEGYDPVAYFTENTARPGSPDFELEWEGGTWRFVSAENRERFKADPERYAPQYGGYCAYAAAKGSVASGDAEAWTIHEGRLYLNYSPSVRREWRKNIPAYVERADARWPRIAPGH